MLLLLFGKRGELAAAWRQLSGAAPGWVALAIGAESLSLLAFAWLQHRVLRLSGTTIPLPGLFALALANDAIANTVPGEPAVSSAYRYRYYRRRGASGASAGWAIFSILIAQAIGMSLVLLLGVVIALAGSTSMAGRRGHPRGPGDRPRRGRGPGPPGPGAGAGGRGCARTAPGHRAPPRPARGARVEANPRAHAGDPAERRSTAGIVAIAAAVWCATFSAWCAASVPCTRGVPWHGVLLAYGVAQVVGSFPIVPGGLGLVEGSLAVVLVAYGAGRVPAVSAALAFRIVNFWLPIAVGWVTVALIARRLRGHGGRGAQDQVQAGERGRPGGLAPDGPASVPGCRLAPLPQQPSYGAQLDSPPAASALANT